MDAQALRLLPVRGSEHDLRDRHASMSDQPGWDDEAMLGCEGCTGRAGLGGARGLTSGYEMDGVIRRVYYEAAA